MWFKHCVAIIVLKSIAEVTIVKFTVQHSSLEHQTQAETSKVRKAKIGRSKIYLGDCRKVLKRFQDDSIDAVVSDPPYDISFMGKGWDST